MVNEVNKLIYNAIVKYHAVYLPDVGTLSVVRHPATMRSKNELIPPRFDVELSLDNRAKSLVDIISAEVAVDKQRAEEIYARWSDKLHKGGIMVIDRVGTLRNNSFVADAEIIKALNISNQPFRITRKRNYTPLYLLLTLVVLGALGYGGWRYFDTKQDQVVVEIVAEEQVMPEVELPLVQDTQPVEIEMIEEASNNEIIESDWRENEGIRHWVVVGSYSTTENAERAIADIVKRLPEMQCNYFKLGSMFAVAAFGSADIVECQEFKNAHSKEFPQSWVYTPKRYR